MYIPQQLCDSQFSLSVWPGILIESALFNTLHAKTYAGIGRRGGISRERFFFYCFAASAIWYLVPGYLFKALRYFSWVCWLAPDNLPVNEMFGYIHGMGMNLFTFDWSQIVVLGSPLASPWWSEANALIGFVGFFWILTPILHYSNVWSGKYLPISSSYSYDNTGQIYNVSKIINDDGPCLSHNVCNLVRSRFRGSPRHDYSLDSLLPQANMGSCAPHCDGTGDPHSPYVSLPASPRMVVCYHLWYARLHHFFLKIFFISLV